MGLPLLSWLDQWPKPVIYIISIAKRIGCQSVQVSVSCAHTHNTSCAWPGVVGVFDGVMKMGAATMHLAIDEVGPMGAGDTDFERGHFTLYDKDGKVFDEEK